MLDLNIRVRCFAVATAALLAMAATLSAHSQTPPRSQPGATQTFAQELTGFLNAPSVLIGQFPNGGPEMIGRVRELAIADAATFPLIMGLLANANKEQKTAIGAGLAQAARVIVRTNQAYALQIQQAIANSKDQEVVLAFAAVSGDRPIGAAGGGGGGGGGAIGGQTNPLPVGSGSGGAAQTIGGGGVGTGSYSYSSSVSGLSGTIGSTTSNLSAPVSP